MRSQGRYQRFSGQGSRSSLSGWSQATRCSTKLDRIGRDSIDVQRTVELCAANEIRLIVLQLGNLDLTSSSGALMVKVLAAVADL